MISAFKRLVHTNNGQTAGDKANDDKKRLSSGVQPMDSSLQKKFSKGVQYNMKIIIRGDKNVGKTCLFLRLQGDQFKEEYVPTEEIKVANIEWNYNVTDDKVKVEIWEICDRSRKRKPINELKLNEKKSNSKSPVQSSPEQDNNDLALDAEFVDVYKNTNGVILVFDLKKSWTFEYIEKEIENIPKNIPIIILGNHKDQGHHGVAVNEEKVKSFIETIERESSGQIRYVETSMRNGFGLKFLYKWFNLPFLHLKKQTLLKQLQTNDREIEACCLELIALEESDDHNYERFLYTIQNKRREIADKLSQVPKPTNPENNNLVSKSIPFNLAGTSNNGHLNANEIIRPTPSIIIGANNPLPIPKNYKVSPSKQNSSNKDLSSSNKEEKRTNNENETEEQAKFRQFLEDAIEVKEELSRQPLDDESENEEDLDQPKILSYQDELDEEDRIQGQPSSILETNKIDESETNLNIKNELNEEFKNELKNDELNDNLIDSHKSNNDKIEKKINGHKESKKSSKENKITINLVDNLPDKTILEKSHTSKSKKSKKNKKAFKDSEKLTKKKPSVEEFIGPYVAPIDQGPSGNEEEYFAL